MSEFNEEMIPEQVAPPSVPTPSPRKPKKNRFGFALVAVALCFSLLGSALGAGIVLLLDRNNGDDQVINSRPTRGQETSGEKNDPDQEQVPEDDTTMLEGNRENTVIEIDKIDTSKVLTPAEVYAANVNSTVGITTSITTNYWGFQSTSAASGSGFIISSDGYILTNHHVIEDSDSITVALYSGEEYEAELIGYDESNDIAVLKIEAENLVPVVLGDSDNLNVGDTVLAIGNPLGELTFSLTVGVVSAMNREVTFSNGVTMDLLQTDCAINSGNSGGALFNLYGEVIGVTNAKYSNNSSSGASIDNVGFAIPMNNIRVIVDSIIEKGYISKPYLGVTVKDMGKENEIYGLPMGAAVQSVTEDSPAEKAGLKVGDIVTAVNGTTITTGTELADMVADSQIGDILKLTVFRSGKNIEIQVEIGEQIQSAQGDTKPEASSK